MEKKLTRRESRETAFLTAFAATFEPEEPTVPAEEHAAPDAFANQLLAAATLWAVSIYLRSKNRCCWPAAAPAALMVSAKAMISPMASAMRPDTPVSISSKMIVGSSMR